MGVIDEVAAERRRQDDKWGEQRHLDGVATTDVDRVAAETARRACGAAADNGTLTWRLILDEEVHEAFAEADPALLRAELIQVAAVAVAWVEAIDRRAAVPPRDQPPIRRSKPSCTALAINRPSEANIRPVARPRLPEADGLRQS